MVLLLTQQLLSSRRPGQILGKPFLLLMELLLLHGLLWLLLLGTLRAQGMPL